MGQASIVIYAGSLVNPEILAYAAPGVEVHDSASMCLEEVTAIYARERENSGIIARVHTGDPSIYGAEQEQIDYCDAHDIPCEVVPGVSSFSAAAAALKQELTLPGVSQSVVITRIEGRTPVPKSEKLEAFASTGCTLAIFLSVQRLDEVSRRLRTCYPAHTPIAVCHRVSWPDERLLHGTLEDIVELVERAGIRRQAIILVGGVLLRRYQRSRLYDPAFTHGFRTGAEQ